MVGISIVNMGRIDPTLMTVGGAPHSMRSSPNGFGSWGTHGEGLNMLDPYPSYPMFAVFGTWWPPQKSE